jgi:demethylmenaquinone methyltransferase/2-methoxy-6-polyprenyl-1,4-benzoquinol methylase
MHQLSSLRVKDCLTTPEGKQHFNLIHFSESAKHYDFATRAMSLGSDQSWKRYLINYLPSGGAPSCLDLACGSGDLAFSLAQRYPKGQVVGLDITEEMLKIARARNSFSNLSFVQNDMCPLAYPDSCIDIVTGGYALRNAPDLKLALREVYRVLKPGGYAAFLDFSKPVSPLLQGCQYWLLKLWCGMWGLMLHGTSQVHGYISASLRSYPDSRTLSRLYWETGFHISQRKKFLGGITEVVLLRKPTC